MTARIITFPAVLISVALLLTAIVVVSESMVQRDGASAAPSFIGSCVAPTDTPTPTPTATTTPQAPKKTIVVAAFTGFSGSSGRNIGMQQLLNAYPPAGGNVVAKRRFGMTQDARAVAFIQAFAPPAEVVLVGHSTGGATAMRVARRLGR